MNVAILRDVVDRLQISNVAGLRWLVRHLLGNAASRFSVGSSPVEREAVSKPDVGRLFRPTRPTMQLTTARGAPCGHPVSRPLAASLRGRRNLLALREA